MGTISETFSAALHHYRAGNVALADALFQQVLADDSNHADALHFLGLIRFAKGQHGPASEFLQKAIRARPTDALLYTNLGNVLTGAGKLGDAVACYRRALELEPGQVAACYNLATALHACGRTHEAIALYQRTLELQPGLHQAHHNLGQAYQSQHQLDKAAASYRQALEWKPDSAETHLSLGNVLFMQHKSGEAAACYRRAVELAPDCAQAHANLAAVLRAQGRYDEAIASCRCAVALSPDNIVALSNWGDALLAQGELRQAIELYQRGVQSDPAFALAGGHPIHGLQQLALLDDALRDGRWPLVTEGNYPYAIRRVSTNEEAATTPARAELYKQGEQEQDCTLVSSHGILKSCDVRPDNQHTVRTFEQGGYPVNWVERLEAGQSVYVCTSAMADFVANVFPRLPETCPPFILVTGNADELAPADIFSAARSADDFLSSPRIIAWFAQNCVGQHPKLFPLPIGLDYHTIAAGHVPWWGPRQSPAGQEADLLALRRSIPSVSTARRAYANFQFSMSVRFGRDRRAAMAQISPDCVYYEARKTPRIECWRRQRFEHRFVVSPAGNGLDCHRTWEALCLGCIPIVRSSPLDQLWDDLPVWVVKSWSEVTEESMSQKAEEIDENFASYLARAIPPKLLLKTWIQKIRRAGEGGR